MKMRFLAVLVLCVAALLGAVACSGGGESTQWHDGCGDSFDVPNNHRKLCSIQRYG